MSKVFQPQVAEINSVATPQEGVADTSGVDLFEAAGKIAVEGGFALAKKDKIKQLKSDLSDIAGERAGELNNLGTKLDNISQAMESSTNSVALRNKARALLTTTIAEAPYAEAEARAMYDRVLGTGSSGSSGNLGGVFSLSVEEKAVAKFNEKVVETQVNLGLTREGATERVRANAQNSERLKQYEMLEAQGKVDGDMINNNVNQSLAHATLKSMDAIAKQRSDSGGAIDSATIAFYENSIDEQAAVLFQDALNSLTNAAGDPITNPPNKATIDGIQTDINAWVTKTKAYLNNSSATKMISDLNRQSAAREQFIIHENFGPLDIISRTQGQAGVKATLDWVAADKGVIKDWLKLTNPQAAAAMGQYADIDGLMSRSLHKMLGVTPQLPAQDGVPPLLARPGLSEDESLVISSALLNPTTPAALLRSVFNTTAEDVRAKESLKSMFVKQHDSVALLYGEKYKDYLIENKGNALQVADVALSASGTVFNTLSYAQSGKAIPASFEIKVYTPEGKFGVPRVTAVGSGLSTEMVGVINNTYRMFNSNSQVLAHFIKENKLPPETTAEQATQAALLGKDGSQGVLFPKEVEATSEAVVAPEDDGKVTPEQQAIKVEFDRLMSEANTPLEEALIFKKLLRNEIKGAK